MRPDRSASDAIRDFAALRSADRRAISSHLSVLERRTLKRLTKRRRKAGRPTLPSGHGLEVSDHSPQMKKLLRRVLGTEVSAGEHGVTSATRKVLAQLLTRAPAPKGEAGR
jgi:hypothetical protein